MRRAADAVFHAHVRARKAAEKAKRAKWLSWLGVGLVALHFLCHELPLLLAGLAWLLSR